MQRDQLLLTEIIDACERVIVLAGDGPGDDIERDRDRREALLWNFTVLGEAIGQLSEATRLGHAEIPWSDPVRLRNRIVHGYWSVDVDLLLTTARDDVPVLLRQVRVAAGATPTTSDE